MVVASPSTLQRSTITSRQGVAAAPVARVGREASREMAATEVSAALVESAAAADCSLQVGH